MDKRSVASQRVVFMTKERNESNHCFAHAAITMCTADQSSAVLVLGSRRQILQLGQQPLRLIALPKQKRKEDLKSRKSNTV
eukprot:COSAG06_NODE_3554_length_5196_cov_4.040024_6_plen_81_part_00